MIAKQKQKEEKNNIGSVVAGITGAAIGVAVAGAAVVLNDKDNRKKVKGILTNIKDEAMSYMQDVHEETDKKEKEIKKMLIDNKNEEAKATN